MKNKVCFKLTLSLLLSIVFQVNVNGQWLGQYCNTNNPGNYCSAATITPTTTSQTSNITRGTGNYCYPFWTFAATAGTTYYFNLCSSSGTSATRLRLHNDRINGSSYCWNGSNPTLVLENVANGCSGSGTGLSKLIWTCVTSGTYYLETAASATSQYWGVSATQTASLTYYTIPSQITTCADSFYDTGITGLNGNIYGYNNNESWVTTYFPSVPGNVIEVSFTSFDTQSGSDLLYIYNGNSTTSPMFPGSPFSGTTNPGTFKSTACDGAITFRFTSNNTVIGNGWVASVNCVQGSAAQLNVEITGSNVLCLGDSLNLSANIISSNGPVSFQWQFNNTNIPGATQANYYATMPGTYNLIATDSSGCSITTSDFIVTSQQSPLVSITGTSYICAGGSTNLIVNASPGSGSISGYQWYQNGTPIPGASSSSYVVTTPGVYNAVVSNTVGCSTTSTSISVSVLPDPTANFNFSANGLTVDFTDNSSNGSTYTWDFGDGSPTVNSPNPTHIFPADGTYDVTLTVTNACGTSTITQQVTVVGTSLSENQGGIPITIYPNPASDILNVSLGTENKGNVIVRFFNINGQLIFEKTLSATHLQIDISPYSKGEYVFQLSHKNRLYNSTIILK